MGDVAPDGGVAGGKAEGSSGAAGGARDGLVTGSSDAGVSGAETPFARRSDSLRMFLMSMECSNGAEAGADAAVGTGAHAGLRCVASATGD